MNSCSLKVAGAILLTTINIPEASLWVEVSNCLNGRTNNPHDLRRCVGGSTGGEGAIIAAAGAVIDVGSDIGGSVRIPAKTASSLFALLSVPPPLPMSLS